MARQFEFNKPDTFERSVRIGKKWLFKECLFESGVDNAGSALKWDDVRLRQRTCLVALTWKG